MKENEHSDHQEPKFTSYEKAIARGFNFSACIGAKPINIK